MYFEHVLKAKRLGARWVVCMGLLVDTMNSPAHVRNQEARVWVKMRRIIVLLQGERGAYFCCRDGGFSIDKVNFSNHGDT